MTLEKPEQDKELLLTISDNANYLANILGMHFDAEHVKASYMELVTYWNSKKKELIYKVPENKREKKDIAYSINKINAEIKRIKQHCINIDIFAEDFKTLFLKSSNKKEESYDSLLDQFYVMTDLHTKLLREYIHTYFTLQKGDVFTPAILIKTDKPIKGKSVCIKDSYYNIRTVNNEEVSTTFTIAKNLKNK